MTDREKIVKAIEICYITGNNCAECPFFHKEECNNDLMRDTLELLKEQEPVCTEYAGSVVLFSCRECKSMLHFGQRYCSMCGRKVKWDSGSCSRGGNGNAID